MINRLIIILMVILFSVSFGGEGKDYKSYVLGTSDGNIILSESENNKYPLASVTKMMTLLVVYDEISKGNLSKEDRIEIDEEVAKIGGSKIYMKAGQKIKVDDLIKATAIHSANNAAFALAKHVGRGNVDNFVNKMREKAKDLGLENEVEFYTPTGLPTNMTGKEMDKGTAYGIYKLGIEALKNDDYIKIASQKSTTIYSGKIKLMNRNKLLGKEGIFGIKTGHHNAAGYNMAVASNKNNIELVYVVLGGKNETIRDKKIISDISQFYNENRRTFLLRKDSPIDNLYLEESAMKVVEVFPDKDFSKIIKKDSKIIFEIKYNKIELPLKKDEVIGKYNLILDHMTEISGDLVVRENILNKKMKFSEFSI
ncbi:D-alanyl-D-alanine carboxypeptidase family protein [Fusobacterium sp.]|uniref:D-alanyl-D-alanine carboxypeptidase family protein n=1 Tax=Fusobacterium sp. TaxID=68766 RepID=UPI002639532F|nr:D-alanyl-D-alanine carboxypeptidase family protein [Fusobacterium sp.]